MGIDAIVEKNQGTWIKRWFVLITGKAYKVLQIWISCDLLDQLPVRVLEFCLYDQCPECGS